ncbi:MAG: PAS domain-containing protein [Desulfohalobiaceae bacterium]|nr:PAS domain-containing protein [Desulfohalobiaceae bacterium]
MIPRDEDKSIPIESAPSDSESKLPATSGEESGTEQRFPIVGLGASAGGLEALRTFFSHLPDETGAAYIVLVHMSPDKPSMLPQLLQKDTSVPVEMAADGVAVQPDHIYVIPPHKEISLYSGVIQLLDPVDGKISLPIDFFFRSLALDRGNRAVAIILSGTGSDGTVGLKEVKAAEGLVLVQSEASAKHDGMPRSAANTGLADMILSPEQMPEQIVRYFGFSGPAMESLDRKDRDWLPKIFALLRVQVGHDFSAYKESTLLRRINRRMGLNQVDDHEAYVRFLRQSPEELNALFRELLIGVTNFFRDPQSFEVIKWDILPEILSGMDEDSVFRAWIPGCSTGEEVYSLAMILKECQDELPHGIGVQLFGTDIDGQAIEKAREGVYPASIMADVSRERLARFFHKEGETYRVRKEIRECAVFSVQDVLRDPPFSRLHLLFCRNLLIYLDSSAQKRLLPLFHHTLLPDGVLMLGSSESIGGFTNLFKTLNSTWKIYRRLEVPASRRQQVEFPTGAPAAVAASEGKTRNKFWESIERLTQRAVLERFSLPVVLADQAGTILHIQGRTGKYLEPASGPPTQSILDMAREGLRIDLSSAMRQAVAEWREVVRRNVQVVTDWGTQRINIYVCPLDRPQELAGRLLIAFENIPEAPEATAETVVPGEGEKDSGNRYKARITELEEELRRVRENHQTTIEELESSNEELKSTNEELQSSNEELQSTNEELESSKEELQSLNEELQTLNAELQSKVDELSAAQDDITNLLSSTEIATVFVDEKLRIKRFSNEATRIINLIDSDVGRPLEHQVTNLEHDGLISDLQQVLDKLVPVEREVRTTDGTWYMMRVMPYRSMENRIQGCVVTFRNVDAQKKVQERLQEVNAELDRAWGLVRSIFDMSHWPMAVLDDQACLVLANPELYKLLGLSAEEAEGKDFFSLTEGMLEGTDLRDRLESALKRGEDFQSTSFVLRSEGQERTLLVRGRIVPQHKQRPYRILLSFQYE